MQHPRTATKYSGHQKLGVVHHDYGGLVNEDIYLATKKTDQRSSNYQLRTLLAISKLLNFEEPER